MTRSQAIELLDKYGRIANQDIHQPSVDELKALWASAGGRVEQGWQTGVFFVTLKGKEIAGGRVQLWNRFYDRQEILLPLE